MQTITTIGFDIAKSVFQVNGVDAAGETTFAGRRDCCPPAPRRNLDESYDELQRLRKEVEVAEKRRRDSPERNHSLLVTPCHTGGDPMTMSERETGSLIGSDKVEGTTVYGADDSKIGTIERVMIDKVSGQVNYAVLSFGGFLGIGDDHYPLPWQSLKYDTNLGGYRTNVTEQQLRGAPKYSNDNEWNWTDTGRTSEVNRYYGY